MTGFFLRLLSLVNYYSYINILCGVDRGHGQNIMFTLHIIVIKQITLNLKYILIDSNFILIFNII